ncbi:MAG TPA: PspC domain-containing protein [Acidimicrobiales bacterium]|nr:PspC domain-containing protein [Acidimicrobiales bacterium]
MVGGVAAGLAERLGLDPTVVRAAFVVTALASGFGLAAYVVGWLALPVAAGDERPAGASIIGRARSDTQGLALVVGLVPVLVLLLLGASVLRTPWLGSVAWPLLISAAGLILVWRNGTDADRAPIRQLGAPLARFGTGPHGTWRRAVLRAAVGVVLGTAGVSLIAGGQERAVVRPIGGVALVLGAIVVVFGPWWANLARELAQERRARTRAEERAELASRVHDSVLQTLALVQRHADDPQRVRSLARAQERELRAWLFEGRAPGDFDADVATLGDALRQVQSEVEAAHGARVELVVVGDAVLDERVGALVAAAREATVNAAKWSGAPVVSVYAEAEPEQVSVFVRDRGKGFDRQAVAAHRKGLAESIEGRMARAGGRARVASSPGSGTEVELAVPVARPAGHRRREGRA